MVTLESLNELLEQELANKPKSFWVIKDAEGWWNHSVLVENVGDEDGDYYSLCFYSTSVSDEVFYNEEIKVTILGEGDNYLDSIELGETLEHAEKELRQVLLKLKEAKRIY